MDKSIGLQQFAQHNSGILRIRHFNTNCCFSGDRGFDSNIGSSKIQFNIVRQTDNFAYFNALFRLKFISCYRRSAACIRHSDINTKTAKRFLKFCRCFAKCCCRIFIYTTLWRC